jgi:hypothetical protein
VVTFLATLPCKDASLAKTVKYRIGIKAYFSHRSGKNQSPSQATTDPSTIFLPSLLSSPSSAHHQFSPYLCW